MSYMRETFPKMYNGTEKFGTTTLTTKTLHDHPKWWGRNACFSGICIYQIGRNVIIIIIIIIILLYIRHDRTHTRTMKIEWSGKWLCLTKQQWKQEAFEKCWAHSPLRAVLHCHSPGVATVARRLRIDVHDNDDNNDNDKAWQRGPLWPHRMGPITINGS